MGKRKSAKNAGIVHKEAFQRMSYLYQAAHAVLVCTPGNPQLSRFYIHSMKTISKRLVLKIDPSIKRTLCKSCDTLLVPGVTCTHRIRPARETHVVVKCLTCGTLKRFISRSSCHPSCERGKDIIAHSSLSGSQTRSKE